MSSPTPDLPADDRGFAPPPVRPEVDAERVHNAMRQWRRRSKLIRFLRKALPVGIALVSLSLVGWIGVKSFIANLPNLATNGGSVRMTNPRFYGQDDKGRSYVIGGKEAVRDTSDGGHVTLTAPVLRLSTGPEKTLDISAQTGIFDIASKFATLNNKVHLFDSGSGFVFDTAEAVINSKTGDVNGSKPVSGHGPLGATTASSYAILDHGAKVVFIGNVHSHIVQTGGPGSGDARKRP
ncbi:MAG TPA: LPS export ABC transporter periplasmic protein LptC [Caulobacteraceae bacterium]|jgi:lipopolysaccharide export system protein LptC|nr:LPS export ABC transporter periplasmic protein LptC [Caulobacteraceae bacterium]